MSVASSMSSSSPGEWQGFFFLKKKATKRKETGKVCGKVCLFVCFGDVLCIGRQLELIVWDVWDGDSVR